MLPSDVLVERLADSTDMRFSVAADRTLTVRRALEAAVTRYEFADGTVWTPLTLINQVASPGGSVFSGDDTDNNLNGSSGGDIITGRMGNDVLLGYAGDDEILGGEGSDTVIGGFGSDTLDGGAGEDIYEFSLGDGVDRIIDLTGAEKIRFGSGVLPSALVATRESIEGVEYIRLSYSANDAILIRDGVQFEADAFEFANGVRVSADVLFSEVLTGASLPVIGSANNDNLFGYASADVLRGLAGADTLTGGAGDDRLEGGTGADLLLGGTGVDSYVLAAGEGKDRIDEMVGQTSRLLLSSIEMADLTYARLGNDLMVAHTTSNASVFVKNAYSQGSSWVLVDEQGTEFNLLSVAATAIEAQTTAQRKASFAKAVDAQAGPGQISTQFLSEPGSVSTGVGSTDERLYVFDKTVQLTQNDSEVVTLNSESMVYDYSTEYLYSLSGSRTYNVTYLTYNVTEMPIKFHCMAPLPRS